MPMLPVESGQPSTLVLPGNVSPREISYIPLGRVALTVIQAGGAITFIYEEARNFYGANQYITRLSGRIMTQAASSAGTQLASQILAQGNASAILAAAPEGTVTGPFNYNLHNLHPFDQLAVSGPICLESGL